MSLTESQQQIIFQIDKEVNKISEDGIAIFMSLNNIEKIMQDLEPIIRSGKHRAELDSYCQTHHGFYRFMKALEILAKGIERGKN